MIRVEQQLVVLKELKEYILPLSEEEFGQLERNIIAEGCRDPLIAWEKDGKFILVDGHNRFKICTDNDIPYKVKKMSFADLEHVKAWMVDNQMGRRNLNPDQLSYYRGLKYLSQKKKKGGYDQVKSKGQNETSTSDFLAEQFTVSKSTIKRDAKFAEGLNIIGKSNPKLKTKILLGTVKVKKADIQAMLDAKNPDTITIRNEADLHNKAKKIRDEALDEMERKLKKIKNDRIEKARETLAGKEPVFLNREERLKTIKGMIISAINTAINDKDVSAIKKLKKLIDKFENLILAE